MRVLAPLILLLAACGTSAPPDRGAVLAIGDSILAWNGRDGIPEVAAAGLGRPVVDASVPGARLLQDRPVLAALGLDIRRQWAANRGRWAWVILDGGGNDLRGVCRTPGEAAALDALIAPDLTGTIPTLIADIRATGSPVAFVGYYDGAAAEPTGFTPCQSAFDAINVRMVRLASGDAGLVFVDAGDVIDPARRELYARDLIHPAPEASRLIGEALAAAMR